MTWLGIHLQSNYYVIWISNQFRLFGVDPDYHILKACRQQVTDAIIRYRKFFFTLIILNRREEKEIKPRVKIEYYMGSGLSI